ncbi:MAG: hypothetical protein N2486_08285 [Caloramator sp.]|nr:hypothetical protein [Caloramator sp.]
MKKNANVILYLFAALCWIAAAFITFSNKNVKLGILYIVLALMNLILAYLSRKKKI